jgi:hypothetical protein
VQKEKHKGRLVVQYEVSKVKGNNVHKRLTLKIRKIKELVRQHKTSPSLHTIVETASELKIRLRKVKDMSQNGYRFMNLDCLESHVSEITMHVCLCPGAINVAAEGNAPIKLVTEVRSFGIASIIVAQCQGCLRKFTLNSSPRVPGSKRFDVNVRAVWGSMVTGNGPAHLNEILATMNSPGLTQTSFSAIETEIGKW